MKNNRSIKTILLWVFLIVIFFAIYQTISRSGNGEALTFSKFIERALPSVDALDDGIAAGVSQVTVYEKAGLIRYRVQGGEASDDASGMGGDERTVRGDINTVIGAKGQTLLGLMASRGIQVDIKNATLGTSQVGPSTATTHPFSDLVATVQDCLLYTSPSPRDVEESRMPSSA